MIIKGKVGSPKLSDGAEHELRLDKDGSLVVMQGGPKYLEASKSERVFIGSNPLGTPVTTQAGLSATTPALTLYNPVGSGIYMVLMRINITITASPAGAAGFALAYNAANSTAPSSTTDATIISSLIGSNKSPSGHCYRVATLATAPTAFMYLGGTTGASAISGVELTANVDGSIIIIPGVAVSIQATSAAAILASVVWEEIPII